jgi:indole-3-glycerol phosphate synthase
MTDTLAAILDDKAAHVSACKARASLAEITAAAARAARPRGFRAALLCAKAEGRYGLIAEIKKASPSRGLIRRDFDPATLAQNYTQGGASCLSVLTDVPWFQGADAYLQAASAATTLPCLRKDFMIDPYQIVEARALGADCVLLIMAALSDTQADELESAAHELGMDVLIEVHDRAERDRAMRLTSRLLGVNNRNLKTLQVDIATSAELAAGLDPDWHLVGESGLRHNVDLAQLAKCGINSFLVGESLMMEADVTMATRRLLGLAA